MMVSRQLGSPLTLMGTGDVENLQRALTNLAIASGRPAINPGAVTGEINDSTMTAINAALGILTEELPSYVYLPLQGAMIIGATNATAKKYVGQYATQLAMAANTAAAKLKPASGGAITTTWTAVQLPPSVAPGFLSQLFAPGWYKTPFGLLMIGLGLFGGYKFFIAPTKA